MRRVGPYVVAALLALFPISAFAESLSPVGQWEAATGESRYRVTFCGGGEKLCAKLTWLRDDAKSESNLALLNRYVVKGAVRADEKTWSGVINYDGETYSGTVTMVDSDAMQVDSCSGIFCKSFLLHRL